MSLGPIFNSFSMNGNQMDMRATTGNKDYYLLKKPDHGWVVLLSPGLDLELGQSVEHCHSRVYQAKSNLYGFYNILAFLTLNVINGFN
jgi:hypothetical protein